MHRVLHPFAVDDLASDFTNNTYLGETPDFNLRFPPLPKTLVEISRLAEEGAETPDTPRLADVVRADPIIAAFVLRRVNSVYHGVRRAVDDVRQAVLLLGFEEVCNLALTVGMMELEEIVVTGESAAIFRDIMKVSIGAAFFGHELANHLRIPQKSKAFTLGLQHAVGRLVLLYNRPKEYEALWTATKKDFGPRTVTERMTFGTDHSDLGARALERWNYPDTITAVIRSYQRPGALKDYQLRSSALTLSVAVSASEQLCMSLTSRKGKPFFTPTPAMHTLARMTKTTASKLIEQIRPRREEARDYIMAMVQR